MLDIITNRTAEMWEEGFSNLFFYSRLWPDRSQIHSEAVVISLPHPFTEGVESSMQKAMKERKKKKKKMAEEKDGKRMKEYGYSFIYIVCLSKRDFFFFCSSFL